MLIQAGRIIQGEDREGEQLTYYEIVKTKAANKCGDATPFQNSYYNVLA